jgi:biotin carboxyl carrier protein
LRAVRTGRYGGPTYRIEDKMAEITLKSDITGSVWKILSKPGDQVSEDDTMMIIESMKMEIPLSSTDDGVVKQVLVEEGSTVTEGQPVLILEI